MRYNTEIIRIENIEKDKDKIKEAADCIIIGETVAFPTETVYGLGANAMDPNAVRQIFQAKGRPVDNPLIIHVSGMEMLEPLVESVSEATKQLIELFWPGPLTLILKKKGTVPSITTAGLNTAAIRMPDHPVALKLIEYSGVPIAAPSANISGKPSPTTAQHVFNDLAGRIPVILDGGQCHVGLESTVVDMTGDRPEILRPGSITPEQLTEAAGEILINPAVYTLPEGQAVKSPGMKYTHYSPDAALLIVDGDEEKVARYINENAEKHLNKDAKVGIIATDQTKHFYEKGYVISMGSKNKPETIASNLFNVFRQLDDAGVEIIFAEAVEDKHIGIAVMNRMVRAAGFNVIKL